MLISFSGPQSSGKSTLLHAMQEKYGRYGWEFVPEVTRYVKRNYNLPINEDGTDLTQMAIMCEHMRNAFLNFEKVRVLDRCSLDGLVYTCWLCDKGQKKLAVGTYSFALAVYRETISKYDIIFYPDPEDVEIIDDGERSTNVKFRNEIAELFEQSIAKLDNVYKIKGTVEERMNQIDKILKEKNIIQ